MARHTPIQFQKILEPTLRERIREMIRQHPRARSVIEATLAFAAIGGFLTCAAAAPGLVAGIGRVRRSRRNMTQDEYHQIWQSFHRLKKRGDLEFVKEKDGVHVYRFSKKGKEKIKKLVMRELKIARPRKWDKKWRLVLFDIPESHKNARIAFGRRLRELGFYQCQKSAWMYPFPCLEEVEFFKNEYGIKPFVKLFLVDEMSDGKVLYHFRDDIKKTVL